MAILTVKGLSTILFEDKYFAIDKHTVKSVKLTSRQKQALAYKGDLNRRVKINLNEWWVGVLAHVTHPLELLSCCLLI